MKTTLRITFLAALLTLSLTGCGNNDIRQAVMAAETSSAETALSLELLQKAENGDAESQCEVANYYDEKKDYSKALEWYHKAAEQGHTRAPYSIGLYYEQGFGVSKDTNEADK